MTTTPSPLETRVRRVLAAWTFELLYTDHEGASFLLSGTEGNSLYFYNNNTDAFMLNVANELWGPPPAPEPFKVGEWVRLTEKRAREGCGEECKGRHPFTIETVEDGLINGDWFAESIERCPPPQASPVAPTYKTPPEAIPRQDDPAPHYRQPASLPEPAKYSNHTKLDRFSITDQEWRAANAATCFVCKAPFTKTGHKDVCRYCHVRKYLDMGSLESDDALGGIGRADFKPEPDGYGLDRKPIAPRFPEPTMAGMVGRVGGRMARRFK